MSLVFPTIKTLMPIANAPGQVDIVNQSLLVLDAGFVSATAKNASTSTPPGSPGDEAYIIAATATGVWAGLEDYFAVYRNGWVTVPPVIGWVVLLTDDGYSIRYNGTSWVHYNEVGSVSTALTAGTTQTQGQAALTSAVNQVSTVANANDVVTLPPARAGRQCIVGNDGANTLQIFPASGDKIDALSTDASTTLAAAGRARFVGLSATEWMQG